MTTLVLFLSTSLCHGADLSSPPTLDTGNAKPGNTSTSSIMNDEPPTLPEDLESDSRNIPQPEVRIIKKKDTVIEEYRVNGQLRYVKITPKYGRPYYLADTDGDGVLETRENDLDNPPINQWILMEW